MNIAVLEDNPEIVGYLIVAFQLAGHHVDSFPDAVSLFDILFTEAGVRTPLPYDALTVDLLLPGGISGEEVLTRIRRVISPSMLPIIVLSGSSHETLEKVRERFPDLAVVRKPFKLHELLEWVHSLQFAQEKYALRSSEHQKGVA